MCAISSQVSLHFGLLVNYLNLNFIDLKAKNAIDLMQFFDSELAKNKFFIHSYNNKKNNSEIYKYRVRLTTWPFILVLR